MGKNAILAIKEGFGNIQRCCHGVVHVHILYKGISLRFTEEAFLNFASMVKEASSVVMDEGLSNLIRDSEREKEE